MAKFYQKLKTVFTDIEKFLTQQVKDSKLSKAGLSQKTSILNQLNELRNEYPSLQGSVNPEESKQIHLTSQGDDSSVDSSIYEDTDGLKVTSNGQAQSLVDIDPCKIDVSAADCSGVVTSGNLKCRKDKKGNLLAKLAKKQFCVLRGNIFYIYEKQKSKKQMDSFTVDDYRVQPVDEENKKEFIFEMTCDDKKPHYFEATNKDEQDTWISYLQKAAGTEETEVDDAQDEYYADGDGDNRLSDVLYEDTAAMSQRSEPPITPAAESPPPLPKQPKGFPGGSLSPPALPSRDLPPQPEDDDPEAIYEAGDELTGSNAIQSSSKIQESVNDDDDDQAIYDETETPPNSRPSPSPPARSGPSPPPPARPGPVPSLPTRTGPTPAPPPRSGPTPAPPPRQVAAAPPAEEDIYDETEVAPPTTSPPANKSTLFSSSLQQQSVRLDGVSPNSSFRFPSPNKTLPSLPNSPTQTTPEADYECLYHGVWDCSANDSKELAFKRGDVITVISRKYEDKGWWVGKLNNQIGLVPKSFLSEAYERV